MIVNRRAIRLDLSVKSLTLSALFTANCRQVKAKAGKLIKKL